jgi:hypothetical protein
MAVGCLSLETRTGETGFRETKMEEKREEEGEDESLG